MPEAATQRRHTQASRLFLRGLVVHLPTYSRVGEEEAEGFAWFEAEALQHKPSSAGAANAVAVLRWCGASWMISVVLRESGGAWKGFCRGRWPTVRLPRYLATESVFLCETPIASAGGTKGVTFSRCPPWKLPTL